MSQPLLDRIRPVVAGVFGIPAETIAPDSSPTTIEGWDSLGHLNLVLAVEQEFATRLTPEEIERITSVGALARILESHG